MVKREKKVLGLRVITVLKGAQASPMRDVWGKRQAKWLDVLFSGQQQLFTAIACKIIFFLLIYLFYNSSKLKQRILVLHFVGSKFKIVA